MAGPSGPTRPTLPSWSEPGFRRLGVGGGGGGDRPIRAQLVVALTAGLILLAVPLYLWRRPSGVENLPQDAGTVPVQTVPAIMEAGAAVVKNAESKGREPIELSAVQQVKCSASPGARGQTGNLCDRLAFFEEALAKAIRATFDCAPKTGRRGNVNYVLAVDFRRRGLRVYPGKSGQWHGPQAKRAAACVRKALPKPEWGAMRHQYSYYLIAIMATYLAPHELADPDAPPTFE